MNNKIFACDIYVLPYVVLRCCAQPHADYVIFNFAARSCLCCSSAYRPRVRKIKTPMSKRGLSPSSFFLCFVVQFSHKFCPHHVFVRHCHNVTNVKTIKTLRLVSHCWNPVSQCWNPCPNVKTHVTVLKPIPLISVSQC